MSASIIIAWPKKKVPHAKKRVSIVAQTYFYNFNTMVDIGKTLPLIMKKILRKQQNKHFNLIVLQLYTRNNMKKNEKKRGVDSTNIIFHDKYIYFFLYNIRFFYFCSICHAKQAKIG